MRIHRSNRSATLRGRRGIVLLVAGVLAMGLGFSDVHAALAGEAVATVFLGAHRFGRVREPDAVVARAEVGSGRDRVGLSCPPPGGQGRCEGPTSFDIAPDGWVWVLDDANKRLLGWSPGHPLTPSRTIRLSFAPSDMAIGPDGTFYVSGTPLYPGFHLSLYAIARDGRQLWREWLFSAGFNSPIRMGPRGILYSKDSRYGWAPAIGVDGRPLSKTEQRRHVQSYTPTPAGFQLALTGVGLSEVGVGSWRVGLATDRGKVLRVWRITSTEGLGVPDISTPAMVGKYPVVVFPVYNFKKHLKEEEVLSLSRNGGTLDRFSLADLLPSISPVTDIRVGPDGALYQMQVDSKSSLKIARYSLEAAAASSPSPSVSPGPSVTSTPGTPATNATPSAVGPSVRSRTSAGITSASWLAISVAIVVFAGALVGAVWLRRRSRSVV